MMHVQACCNQNLQEYDTNVLISCQTVLGYYQVLESLL